MPTGYAAISSLMRVTIGSNWASGSRLRTASNSLLVGQGLRELAPDVLAGAWPVKVPIQLGLVTIRGI
jgi:hypothetical protein